MVIPRDRFIYPTLKIDSYNVHLASLDSSACEFVRDFRAYAISTVI